MLLSRIADKPQYVFHPTRLFRRLMHVVRPSASTIEDVTVTTLPWGLPLGVNPGESIGFTILTARVFDPCVTETLHRLIDPGELVVDVGANVGYLSSLAAARAGAAGTVVAYEPHPRVFELLDQNAARWRGRPGVATVETRQAAVTDKSGTAELESGPLFHMNMGLASLADASGSGATAGSTLFEVQAQRLDDAFAGRQIGVLKVDVEGHEPAVLAGAEQLLRAGAIRDVIFEDHNPYPDECTRMLENAGYHLVALDNDLFGLRLLEPRERVRFNPWPGPSYLATRDPDRAFARLRPRGWQVPEIGPSLPRIGGGRGAR
jgi:FkbM family methyltransferase